MIELEKTTYNETCVHISHTSHLVINYELCTLFVYNYLLYYNIVIYKQTILYRVSTKNLTY